MNQHDAEAFRYSRNAAMGDAVRARLAPALTFYIQHGGAPGPFLTLPAPARERWNPQPRRGSVVACRFEVLHAGRWHRLYSDAARPAAPHFIRSKGQRLTVSGVAP